MANPISEALGPFVWGAGGSKKTPEEIARDKEIAAELLMKAGNTSPVGHWTQGAARMVDALGGVIKQRRADAAGIENDTYNQGIISSLLGGGASTADSPVSASIPASGAGAEIAATSPAQPIDMTGNEVYSGFMDAVKTGVQNPFALAAIAATGQRESQFSPGNVNRTWSDPSESGQPGTAGGIMSWRGPRYQALAATGDLSPQGQAKFFLQENPQLIEALNNAGSVEEAQSLMNRAWAFAGHDRPGGETAARLAAAQGFLPTFQASGEVAAATPQAAIEAISPTGGSLSDEVAAFEQTPAYSAQFPGRQAPAMDPAQEVGPAPVVAGQPMQAEPQAVDGAARVAQALPAAGQPQQAAPFANEAIIRAMTDPRATPQTRAIAQALMQQQQAQQAQAAEQQQWMERQQYEQQQLAADPLRQLQLEKGQIELEQARQPQRQPLINAGNGNVYDPNTGSWLQAPGGVEKIPDAVRALDIRAKRAGLKEGTPEYNEFMISGGRGGMSLKVGPDGVEFQQGGSGKTLTESQSKLTLFQSLQTETQPVLLDLENQFNPANLQDAAARSTPIAGNFFKSEQGQIYDSAATAWAEGALRIATGAAATPEEMERTKRAYFAQPGDTPNTISFKAQMREMYSRSIDRSLSKDAPGALPLPSDFANKFDEDQTQSSPVQKPNNGWKDVRPGVRIREAD